MHITVLRHFVYYIMSFTIILLIAVKGPNGWHYPHCVTAQSPYHILYYHSLLRNGILYYHSLFRNGILYYHSLLCNDILYYCAMVSCIITRYWRIYLWMLYGVVINMIILHKAMGEELSTSVSELRNLHPWPCAGIIILITTTDEFLNFIILRYYILVVFKCGLINDVRII